MSKHTKGPWTVELPLEDEMDQRPLITAHEGRVLVAEVLQPLTDEEGLYKGHYDGLLLAAAPDLLDALQALLFVSEPFHRDSDAVWREVRDKVHAALRKATGQEPTP